MTRLHGSPLASLDTVTEDSSISEFTYADLETHANHSKLLFCPCSVCVGLQVGARGERYLCEDLGYQQAYGLLRYGVVPMLLVYIVTNNCRRRDFGHSYSS